MAIPSAEIVEFDVSALDPIGSRHLTTHAAYIGTKDATEINKLDFGSVNNTSAAQESDTKVVLWRVVNLNGMAKTQNMRFWAPYLPSPNGVMSFNSVIQAGWVQNNALSAADPDVLNSLPATQNLYRTDGSQFISDIDDLNVSQWIYLNVSVDTDVTTGRYGVGGRDQFLYRVTFDYTN